MLLAACILTLAACGNEAEEAESEEVHEEQADHDHDSDLEMVMTLDNDPEPSVMTIELEMEDEDYEADRVRLEIEDENDEENIEWIDAEAEAPGLYTAELEAIDAGTYNVVLHVNGPDELHDHSEETFEVE